MEHEDESQASTSAEVATRLLLADDEVTAVNATTSCRPVQTLFVGDLTGTALARLLFTAVYGLTIALAVPVNLAIIVAIIKNRFLHSVRYFFLISLFVCDVMLALSSGVFTPVSLMLKTWHFGAVACSSVPLFQGMSVYICTFTLTAIAFDRYILIVHPTKRPLRLGHAIRLSVFIWLLALLLATPPVMFQRLGEKFYNDERLCGLFCAEEWPSENARKLYGVTSLVLQFVTPLAIILFSYVSILARLRKQQLKRNRRRLSTAVGLRRYSQRRTTLLLALMVLVFVVCWLPQVVFNLSVDLNILPWLVLKNMHLTSLLCHYFATCSVIVNPILYALNNEQLKEGLRAVLPACLSCLCSPQTPSYRVRLGSLQLLAHAPSAHYNGVGPIIANTALTQADRLKHTSGSSAKARAHQLL